MKSLLDIIEGQPSLVIGAFVLNTILLLVIVREYYAKLLNHAVANEEIFNESKKAIVLSFINNLPRCLFALCKKTSTRYTTSTVYGLTTTGLTIGISGLIFSSIVKCFMTTEHFFKDVSIISLFLSFQYVYTQESICSIQILKLIVIIFVLFCLLSSRYYNIAIENSSAFIAATDGLIFLEKINDKITKYLFDFIIGNVTDFYKATTSYNYKKLLTPIVNNLFFIIYVFEIRNWQIILFSTFLSLFLGFLLVKDLSKHEYARLNTFYSLLVSIGYIYHILINITTLLDILIRMYGLSKSYLQCAVLSLFLMIPEILGLMNFPCIHSTGISVSSLFCSLIFNNTALFPFKQYLYNTYEENYKGNDNSIALSLVTILVIVFNYCIRNQKLSRDLAYLLIFNYFLFHFAYIVDYRTLIKPIF